MIETCDIVVQPDLSYQVTAILDIEGAAATAAPAILTCRAFDGQGRELAEPSNGFLLSDLYGPHMQLGMPGLNGDMPIAQIITPPAGTASLRLTLHRWRARQVALRAPMQVAPYSPPAPDAGPDHRLMQQIERPAQAGDIFELTAHFDRTLDARAVVAAVRFTAADGTHLAPEGAVPLSGEVGHFHYMAPSIRTDDDTATDHDGFAKFHAPPGAAQISVQLLRWSADSALTLLRADLTPRSAQRDVIGSGELAIGTADWCAFRANILVAGPQPTLVDLSFYDAGGHLLPSPAQGLERGPRYDNFARLTPDPLSRHDGRQPIHLAFRPPAGAQLIRWHLQVAGDATRSLDTVPILRALTAKDDAAQPPWTEPEAGLGNRLSSRLPDDPAPGRMQQQGYAPIARLASAVDANTWIILTAQLARAAGGLHHANIILHAAFFDTAGAPLPYDPAPGFGTTTGAGIHRSLCIPPQDPAGTQAQIEAPVRIAKDAAYAVFSLIARHHDSGITADGFAAKFATVTEVQRCLSPTFMNRPQLIQALDIANYAGGLQARHAIYQALSIVDSANKGYAYRARVLAETLQVQAVQWRPEVGQISPYSAKQTHILHLTGAADPPPAIAQQQAMSGLLPVICPPLGAHRGDAVPLGDGTAEALSAAGAVRAVIDLPSYEADDLSPPSRLCLETRLQNRILQRHQCAFVHVHAGIGACATALRGIALAQAHRLPLIYDLHEMSEIDLSHEVRLFGNEQADRCLAAADRIVVATLAAQSALTDRGVPSHRIAVIPDAVPPEFERAGPAAEVAHLRKVHNLPQTGVIGHICAHDPAQAPGIVAAGVTELARDLPGLTLVLLGSEAPRQMLAQQLHGSGLRILCPETPDSAEMRAWVQACTIVIPPFDAPISETIHAALIAMAQGTPVILPDCPDTARLAGPDQPRARLVPPQDAAALARDLRQMLAGGIDRAALATTARRWIRTDRLWVHRLTQFEAAYAAAHAAHAQIGTE